MEYSQWNADRTGKREMSMIQKLHLRMHAYSLSHTYTQTQTFVNSQSQKDSFVWILTLGSKLWIVLRWLYRLFPHLLWAVSQTAKEERSLGDRVNCCRGDLLREYTSRGGCTKYFETLVWSESEEGRLKDINESNSWRKDHVNEKHAARQRLGVREKPRIWEFAPSSKAVVKTTLVTSTSVLGSDSV